MLHFGPRDYLLNSLEDKVRTHLPVDKVVFLKVQNQRRLYLIERPNQTLTPCKPRRSTLLNPCALDVQGVAGPILRLCVQENLCITVRPVSGEQLKKRIPAVLKASQKLTRTMK
jgi:hypothetical protein